MVIDQRFWTGRCVLVTGHTGFKGSWLSLILAHHGANVVGFALEPPSEPNMFVAAGIADGITSIIGDIREGNRLAETVERERPEIIIHLAAQSLVRESYRAPIETYATNVMGTANVLEAARLNESVRAVLVVTSDKCYENIDVVRGYRESDAMGGSDPYSSSKACAEIVTSAYRRSFFRASVMAARDVRVASARAGNVIGGGDWAPDRLVPDVIRAFRDKRPVRIRNPHSVRPWQHVLEPLHGYLMLAERLLLKHQAFDTSWNFGPDDADAWAVGQLVDRLCEALGDGTTRDIDHGVHPAESKQLRLDCSKAKAELGWSPRLPLEAAIDWSVEWYLTALKGGDVRGISLDQIRRYNGL